MNSIVYFLFLGITFAASMVGSICGIGGGVIIKPVLDSMGVLSVSEISFLSGCAVLAMSLYSVTSAVKAGNSLIDRERGTRLAVGAAIGGVVGKLLFQYLKNNYGNENVVGAAQAISLLLVTIGTLFYTLNKKRIHSLDVRAPWACMAIGVFMGTMSSFLGIGGGPINLVILYHFFTFDTKTAAQNSLYIILISQLTSLLSGILMRSIPQVPPILLILMIGGGILGGVIGKIINKKINARAVDALFCVLLLIIIGICVYNSYNYVYAIRML